VKDSASFSRLSADLDGLCSCAGAPEPPIPWHGHLFPDGTPVSFTEAAIIRRYATGIDDFLAVDTFNSLPQASRGASKPYLVLDAQRPQYSLKTVAPYACALYELSVWPGSDGDGDLEVELGQGVRVILDVDGAELSVQEKDGRLLASHDMRATGKPEGGVVLDSWNLLRVLVVGNVTARRIQVWFNPQLLDVTVQSAPLPNEDANHPDILVPMRPCIDVESNYSHALHVQEKHKEEGRRLTGMVSRSALGQGDMVLQARPAGATSVSIKAVGPSLSRAFRLDYVSVLPPKLYGLAAS
jgi:hypothetical protein